jgi:signal transduction histidine kinase
VGAGIGLAICKGLVEAHGGQITIDGREGGGTIVTIRLPLDLAERASAQGA